MQLGEAEALGMLDHHDGGFRHVDADLDHGGGDQQSRFAGGEARHRRVLVGAFHAAMDETDAVAERSLQLLEALLRGGKIDLLGFLDQRADPIDALAVGERAADRFVDLADARQRDGAGVDRLAAGRLFRNSETSMSPK